MLKETKPKEWIVFCSADGNGHKIEIPRKAERAPQSYTYIDDNQKAGEGWNSIKEKIIDESNVN